MIPSLVARGELFLFSILISTENTGQAFSMNRSSDGKGSILLEFLFVGNLLGLVLATGIYGSSGRIYGGSEYGARPKDQMTVNWTKSKEIRGSYAPREGGSSEKSKGEQQTSNENEPAPGSLDSPSQSITEPEAPMQKTLMTKGQIVLDAEDITVYGSLIMLLLSPGSAFVLRVMKPISEFSGSSTSVTSKTSAATDA